MRDLVELSRTAKDERVRSLCLVAVLDRASVKPIDYDPDEEKQAARTFNPKDYTPEELDYIEAAPKLIIERQEGKEKGSSAERGVR